RREGEGWTWRDLLNGMDDHRTGGPDQPQAPAHAQAPAPAPAPQASNLPETAPDVIDEGDLDDLADRLIDEIGALGVDPNALLPGPRIEEPAAPSQRGDSDGARQVARRVAPAAVRRIARRVLTEPGLRDAADRFAIGYEALLDDAARKDHEGYRAAALLNSDP